MDEYKKSFYIINNKIKYKKLFVDKEFAVENLTKIEYQEIYYRRHNYKNVHVVRGYIGDKEIFRVKNFTPDELKLMKNLFKEYNPRCVFVKK